MAPSEQDPKQGGDLFDMARDGTTMPNDAGKQNLIPSVPRPDQIEDRNDLGGAPGLEGAADNATDISRSKKDIAPTGAVLTGTGDVMPMQSETKRLHMGANDSLSKGHDRYDKHSRQKESDLERYAGEGAEADVPPGQEGLGQDEVREGMGG